MNAGGLHVLERVQVRLPRDADGGQDDPVVVSYGRHSGQPGQLLAGVVQGGGPPLQPLPQNRGRDLSGRTW